MTQFTATFRIVTPMFLGGAEPTREAELRVPSIKGALRFWWRALMWGKVQDIADLRHKEAELFGSSKTGQSKVLIRLEQKSELEVLNAGDVLESQGQRSAHQKDVVGEGARYLGYGLMEAFDGRLTTGGRLIRACLLAPFEFALHLSFKADTSELQREEVLNAVKLLGLCGGLGSRTRRGYGSLSLVSIKQTGAPTWSSPTDAAAWKNELKAAVGNSHHDTRNLPEWTSFAAGHTKALLVSGEKTSPLELLARLGRDFVFFRSWGRNGKVLGRDSEKRFKEDHDLMKQSVNARRNHPQRIAFGLPHNYGRARDQHVKPSDKNLDRRASPLFFHIHQPSEGDSPLGVLLFLPSRFLPSNQNRISVGGQSVSLAHNGCDDFWKPVKDFLTRVSNGSGKERFSEPHLIEL